MQALVTGGSGFIGSTLIESLNRKNIKVKALLRTTSPRYNIEGLSFEACIGDLCDASVLEQAVQDVDYVFHVAAVVSAKNRQEFFKHNVEGTVNLAQAVKKANPDLKRFVFVSSVAAVGPAQNLEALREDCEAVPISDYGASKLEAEHELKRILQEISVPLSILRPPPVYGPRDRGFLEFVRLMKHNLAPVMKGRTPTGDKYYSMIHSEDLVNLMMASAFEKNLESHEIFFAVGDGVYSWNDILQTIAESMGKSKPLRVPLFVPIIKSIGTFNGLLSRMTGKLYNLNPDRVRQMLADYYVYSNQRAKDKLGFQPRYDLKSGMAQTIEWYRQKGWV